jgi:hypothetical protein
MANGACGADQVVLQAVEYRRGVKRTTDGIARATMNAETLVAGDEVTIRSCSSADLVMARRDVDLLELVGLRQKTRCVGADEVPLDGVSTLAE